MIRSPLYLLVFSVAVFAPRPGGAQGLTGSILDWKNQPVSGCKVSLSSTNASVTSANGNFHIGGSSSIQSGLPEDKPGSFIRNGKLYFRLDAAGPVSLDIYALSGRRLAHIFQKDFLRGSYSLGLKSPGFPLASVPQGIYIVRITTPAGTQSHKVGMGKEAASSSGLASLDDEAFLLAKTAAQDTLTVSCVGTPVKKVPIASYDADLGNIVMERPVNIVFVMVDDLGWTDVSFGEYGSTYHETPNLEKLASQGIMFTNAYAAASICSPTRAAVMTGKYPARTGITDWIRPEFRTGTIPDGAKNPAGFYKENGLMVAHNPLWMELEELTLAEVMKMGGYATVHIGKWHLGAEKWYPEKQGFDYNYGGCDLGQPPSFYDPFTTKEKGSLHNLPGENKGEYLTDRETREAVKFIREHADKPFFMNLNHYVVHSPIQEKPELLAKYQNKKKTTHGNAKYATMVESMDITMGRIMHVLDSLDLAKHTLLVFTSDNGGESYYTNNAPLRKGKGHPYEGGIREPFLARWPGIIKPGSVSDVPIISVDFLPTFAAAANIPLPDTLPIDGKNILPLLRQEGAFERQAIYWHFPHWRNKIAPYSIIRQGDWKLIKNYAGVEFELFNLKNDLKEDKNLALDSTALVQSLNAKLEVWLKETGALVPYKP